MIELQLKPTIYSYDTCREFVEDLQVGADDLIVTNQYIFDPNFKDLGLTCHVLFQEKYGMGEPSDEMAEAIYKDMPKDVKRIIGIGGGTVMDLCKLFVLKQVSPVLDLFDGKIPVEKEKELILIPTTCGTAAKSPMYRSWPWSAAIRRRPCRQRPVCRQGCPHFAAFEDPAVQGLCDQLHRRPGSRCRIGLVSGFQRQLPRLQL